jgi:hypothetical protein
VLSLERGATLAEANPRVTMTLYAGLTKDGQGGAAAKLLDTGLGA